jgi:energy-coupling factor transporter ATP-binding protein EcfA2
MMKGNNMNTHQLKTIDQILIEHTAFDNARNRLKQLIEASLHCSEPVCIALIGESRTGKSRLLEHIANLYPRQRKDEGLRVPILRITTPSKPTVKGLVETFLLELGDPLWNRRGSEIEKTERLITLLIKTGTTMAIIDEFQHFYDKTSHKVQHHISDWLKILVDKAKLVLVVSGLPSCMAVINQNEQLRGRFIGALHMPRFDWADKISRDNFISILEAFQGSMTEFDFPDFSSDNIAFRFYCASGGLIGYVAKILRQAVSNTVFNESAKISLEDLALAYEEAIWIESAIKHPNPFDLRFDPNPTPQLLEAAKAIGIATPEERVHKSRTIPLTVTASQALTA